MASRTQEMLYDAFKALSSRGALATALEHTGINLLQTTASSPQSTGGGVLSTVSKVFTSGLGLVPLISGLFGLFGGGGQPEPPPLVKYAMPERIYFQGADTSAGISFADYDQMGLPRAYGPAPAATGNNASMPDGAPARQITVNVQAMDARSFLDHSAEIAQAVREAMLNLNSINDVVNDL